MQPHLPTIILGAGGHARVLVSILQEQSVNIIGCIALEEPSGSSWPEGIPHIGGEEILSRLSPESCYLVNGIGSSKRIGRRRTIFESTVSAGFRFRGVVHSSAVIAPNAKIDSTALIMAGAIVQSGAWIGPNVLINTGTIVDHDCHVGAHSHIATGARLAGGVVIGDAVHIGAGSTIIQQQNVGSGAVIGAGAVVIRPVAARSCVAGVPAKLLRPRN